MREHTLQELQEKRFEILKELLEFVGIEPRMFRLEWVSASEGIKFKFNSCNGNCCRWNYLIKIHLNLKFYNSTKNQTDAWFHLSF